MIPSPTGICCPFTKSRYSLDEIGAGIGSNPFDIRSPSPVITLGVALLVIAALHTPDPPVPLSRVHPVETR